MTLLRTPVLAWLLSAIIIATGGSLAAARGLTRIAGEIVICVGATVATITVDENGQPVEAAHICPDCVLQHFAVHVGAPIFATFDHTRVGRVGPPVIVFAPPQYHPAQTARGPPIFI